MTPTEIQNKQFDKAMSGYRADDVTAYLSEVAAYAQKLLAEKAELEQKMMVLAEKLEEYREDEDSLRAALIGAQKLGDSVVRESKKKAEQILAEANMKAELMVTDIKKNIERENDILNKMQAEVARFKGQILGMYRQHIEMFNAIPYDEKDYPPNVKPAAATKIPAIEPEKAAVLQTASTERAEEAKPVKKDFVISIEDENLDYEDIPDELPKQRSKPSRHGNLLFGDNYPITRKD